MKTPPRLIQEFKIGRHRNHILVVVPLLADLEVTEDLARHIGFQWPFHHGTEALFRFVKIGLLRRDVQKPKSLQLPEEPLIGRNVTGNWMVFRTRNPQSSG